jgi:hypothetical protein
MSVELYKIRYAVAPVTVGANGAALMMVPGGLVGIAAVW